MWYYNESRRGVFVESDNGTGSNTGGGVEGAGFPLYQYRHRRREKSAEKIREAIRHDQYHLPGLAAGSEIAMLVGGLSGFHHELIRSCFDTAFEENYLFTIIECFNEPTRKEKAAKMLARSNIRGVLVYGSEISDKVSIQILTEAKMPLVLIENDLPEIAADKILVGNYQGQYLLTQKLIESGYHDLRMVPWGMSTRAGAERLSGFLSALRDCGVNAENHYLQPLEEPSIDCAVKMVNRLLAAGELPDVFVCGDDDTGQLIAAACTEAGLRIPEDIAVTGFDGARTQGGTNRDLALTTMRQPFAEMGSLAVKRLIRKIENPDTSVETVLFETALITGATTKPFIHKDIACCLEQTGAGQHKIRKAEAQ